MRYWADDDELLTSEELRTRERARIERNREYGVPDPIEGPGMLGVVLAVVVIIVGVVILSVALPMMAAMLVPGG